MSITEKSGRSIAHVACRWLAIVGVCIVFVAYPHRSPTPFMTLLMDSGLSFSFAETVHRVFNPFGMVALALLFVPMVLDRRLSPIARLCPVAAVLGLFIASAGNYELGIGPDAEGAGRILDVSGLLIAIALLATALRTARRGGWTDSYVLEFVSVVVIAAVSIILAALHFRYWAA